MSDFERDFGRRPDAVAGAPGRVNLIGEHTDYSGGFVMPLAIPQRTRVALGRRADRTARVISAELGPPGGVSFEVGREQRTGGWIDYVQGTVIALRTAGFEVGGFDARIHSDVPVGSGLSSSAALEVSLLRALRDAFELALDDVTIARVGQRAENDFVGVPVGIMDQMASSLADERSALFLDTCSLAFERLPLPASAEIAIIDSGVAHDHAAGHYRTRRAEVAWATERLGAHELRDVVDVALTVVLPPPLDRRARHVITENARVLAAAECLRRGDAEGLGRLFDASHASLRDDFEVSVPDVDRLVALARADARALGARMTGGGFGGAVVALAPKGSARALAERVRAAYDAGGGPRATILIPGPEGGAGAPERS